MSQTLTVQMEKDYPFGDLTATNSLSQKVIVTRKVQVLSNDRQTLLNKALLIQGLQQDSVLQLLSYKEYRSGIEFSYQYVPIKFQNWMQKLTLKGLQKFQQQLFLFIYFLSYNQIIVRIRPSCIGLTNSLDLKYFIDFDFYVDQKCCKNVIFQNYKKQADKLCQLLSKRMSTPDMQTKQPFKQIGTLQKNPDLLNTKGKNQVHSKSSLHLELKSSQIMKQEKKQSTDYSLYSKKAFQEQMNGKINPISNKNANLDMSYDQSKQLKKLGQVPDKLLAQARQILGISLNWRLSNDIYGENLILLGAKNLKQSEVDTSYNTKSSTQLQISTQQSNSNQVAKKYQQAYYNSYTDLDQSAYFDDFAKVLNNDSPKKTRKPSSIQLSSKSAKNSEQQDIKAIQKKVSDAISNSVLLMKKFKSKKN